MKRDNFKWAFSSGLFFSLLMNADTVLATQTHGQPEGLYVHQIAHQVFIVSMGSLEFWLRQRNLIREKGWRYIQLSAVLFILWNINAMAVHFMDEHLSILGITKIDLWRIQIETTANQNGIAFLYYVLKLDHLLCVPAMFCMYYGLKIIFKSQKRASGSDPIQ